MIPMVATLRRTFVLNFKVLLWRPSAAGSKTSVLRFLMQRFRELATIHSSASILDPGSSNLSVRHVKFVIAGCRFTLSCALVVASRPVWVVSFSMRRSEASPPFQHSANFSGYVALHLDHGWILLLIVCADHPRQVDALLCHLEYGYRWFSIIIRDLLLRSKRVECLQDRSIECKDQLLQFFKCT